MPPLCLPPQRLVRLCKDWLSIRKATCSPAATRPPGSFITGAVFQIDPSNGTILRTVASDLTCPTALSVDPLSGDLFTDDSCFAPRIDNPDMWRIVDPDGASPKTTVYATLPGITERQYFVRALGHNLRLGFQWARRHRRASRSSDQRY